MSRRGAAGKPTFPRPGDARGGEASGEAHPAGEHAAAAGGAKGSAGAAAGRDDAPGKRSAANFGRTGMGGRAASSEPGSGRSVCMENGDPDAFTTLGGPHSARIRVLASIFVATAAPTGSREEARAQAAAAARRMHDATHHCWACRLASGEEGWSDAGEPAGTAGRPILDALKAAGVVDAAVVVSRWFGGTKLGKGGLARAYREAAEEALAGAPRLLRYRTERLEVRFGFPETGLVESLLSRFQAQKLESDYGERVRLVAAVPRSRAEELARLLGEALADPQAVRLQGDSPTDSHPPRRSAPR